MRTQRDRDEQTLAIGTALGVFAVVLGAMLLVVWLSHAVSGADDHADALIGTAALVLATGAAVASLVRSRRG